jgi:hypothetical protein
LPDVVEDPATQATGQSDRDGEKCLRVHHSASAF